MKSLNVLDTFSFDGCTKKSKFERVMIVQTHAYDREKWEIVLIFPKKKSNFV